MTKSKYIVSRKAGEVGVTKEAIQQTQVLPRRFNVRQRPHIQNLLSDAYNVGQTELTRMKQAQAANEPIKVSDFERLVNSLTKLSREEREQDKEADPTAHDEEALLRSLVRDPEYKQLLKELLEEE